MVAFGNFKAACFSSLLLLASFTNGGAVLAKTMCKRLLVPYVTTRQPTKSTSAAGRFEGFKDVNGTTHHGAAITSSCGSDPTRMLSTFPRNKSRSTEALRQTIAHEHRAGLYVHGITTDFDSAIKDVAALRLSAKIPTATILVSWPTDEILSYVLDVALERVHARFIEREVIALLAMGELGNDSVILYCHSRGCGILLAVLEWLSIRTPQQRLLRKIRRIIMFSPDLPRSLFKLRIRNARKFLNYAITIYASPEDRVLGSKDSIAEPKNSNDGQKSLGVLIKSLNIARVELISMRRQSGWRWINHSLHTQNETIMKDIGWASGPRNTVNRIRLPLGGRDMSDVYELSEPSVAPRSQIN